MESNFDQSTDGWVSEQIFACASCKNLLSPPIVLVKDIGNVCRGCLVGNEWQGIENETLALILNRLKIPCRFQTVGCTSRPLFSSLKEHENSCQFHERPCLISPEFCSWKGLQNTFSKHFRNYHPEHVLVDHKGLFTLQVDLREEIYMVKLLKSKYESFLTIRSDTDRLTYAVCDIKSNCKYDCIIKHIGKNQTCVEVKSKVSSTLNNMKETAIDLSALKEMTRATDSITIEIRVSSAKDFKICEENILQHFECPVCKTLMKPPIYQCKLGHSVCRTCKPRLEKCPNCRGPFDSTRNFSLEALTAGISYACRFITHGCGEILLLDELDKHQIICSFQPFQCPVEKCSFEGRNSNIIKHFLESHKDKFVTKDFYETKVEFRADYVVKPYFTMQQHFMIFDENIFRINFHRDTDYSFWAVELLRQKERDAVFAYEIGIVDKRKPERKISRSDMCLVDVCNHELVKKCLSFPNNVVAQYCSNGAFTYYCKIRKP